MRYLANLAVNGHPAELGADPAAVVLNGKTALDIARLNERGAVVALLESVACEE